MISGATAESDAAASGHATANAVGADVALPETASTFSQEVEFRKYYMRKGKKILLFDSVEDAEDYVKAEARANEAIAKAHKTSRLARKRLRTRIIADALPKQEIDTDWLAEMMHRFAINFDLPALLEKQDYNQVVKIHAMAKSMQDDEDDVTVLLQPDDMSHIIAELRNLHAIVANRMRIR
jgi:hypothetical protein